MISRPTYVCVYAVFQRFITPPFLLAAVSFFGLICMLKNIKLAIAIIKTATVYIVETPSAMFVPPIVAIVIAIW